MNLRIHVKHDKTFQERLNEQARRLREDFSKTPSDAYRELLLRRASEAEAGSRLEKWLASPEEAAEMTDTPKTPIILHATDALQRAQVSCRCFTLMWPRPEAVSAWSSVAVTSEAHMVGPSRQATM